MIHPTQASELRPLDHDPSAMAVEEYIIWIDPHCCIFIARLLFVMIGLCRSETWYGDVRSARRSSRFPCQGALDERHLAIPDRPGYKLVGTDDRDLSANPQIGLLFVFIPGIGDALRINGTARITRAEPPLHSIGKMEW